MKAHSEKHLPEAEAPLMKSKASRPLVVVLHGYTMSPSRMLHVQQVVQERLEHAAEVFVPPLPMSMFSSAKPDLIARDVFQQISERISGAEAKGQPYNEVILVGHSVGGLIARRIYLLAFGATNSKRFNEGGDHPSQSWGIKITRIILLAGMNRGWAISHHMGLGRAIKMTLGCLIGNLLVSVTRKSLLIFEVRRGAPFLTQLRLEWMEMVRQPSPKDWKPLTIVQLLGSVDDVVSPEDNVDLVTGQSFVYLDVPYSGHENVIYMDDSVEGQARANVFGDALVKDKDALKSAGVLPSDSKPIGADNDVSDVIFVIHGIRDTGYWTQKIARSVQRVGAKPPKVYGSETSTYGYFAMFPFLLPSKRREKVEWLMDQFVEALARYPNARFSYVGHSNGTYLLAKALTEYPACRFHNVVFAGSVVSRNYDWRTAQRRGQVQGVLNYVATADLVVAWFPGAIEKLRLQDLGTAGHNGFDQFSQDNSYRDKLFEVRYIPGGHGAALREENWDAIAHFIVYGSPLLPNAIATKPHRNWFFVITGWFAPIVWLVIAAFLLSVGWLIWKLPIGQWRTLAEGLFVLGIWKILTKV